MMMRPLLDLIRGNIFKSEKYPTFPKEPNRERKKAEMDNILHYESIVCVEYTRKAY